jgi:hypothetical protein
MTKPRNGYNREHVYEPGNYWERNGVSRKVRLHQAHIIHIPIDAHHRMNAELPQMAVMSDRLGCLVLNWVDGQDLPHPEERWKLIEEEARYYDNLSKFQKGRMLGREALYFSECLEIKLPFYRGEK